MISRRWAAGTVAAALLLGACGDSDSGSDPGKDTQSTIALSDGDETDTTEAAQDDRSITRGAEADDSRGGTLSEDADLDSGRTGALSQDAFESSERRPAPVAPEPSRIDRPFGTEPTEPRGTTFVDAGVNPFVNAAEDPLSTFALDVDTASYTVGRAWINEGLVPDPDSVRVEEWVNYFDQNYAPPRDETFAVYADGAPHPFIDDNTYLVRVGIAARDVSEQRRDPANLTFVVDTSGSMDKDNRIELVRDALQLLAHELDADDAVSIVAYSESARVILEPTAGDQTEDIVSAIRGLATGGSTNTEAGLRLGYDLADEMWRQNDINRVVLLSDGVANVGATGPEGILERIGESARRDIHLVSIGVGFGNFNDNLLEQLADQGNGWYAYVDSIEEAERIFVDDLVGSLQTVADDAKVQVEFDQRNVATYRLIGFENRDIADTDFRNDLVDAGEIGAGHTVTALYEVDLQRGVRPGDGEEIATVTLRWTEPGARAADEVAGRITTDVLHDDVRDASSHYRLTASAATFAEILRGSRHVRSVDVRDILDLAEDAASEINTAESWDLVELIEAVEQML